MILIQRGTWARARTDAWVAARSESIAVRSRVPRGAPGHGGAAGIIALHWTTDPSVASGLHLELLWERNTGILIPSDETIVHGLERRTFSLQTR